MKIAGSDGRILHDAMAVWRCGKVPSGDEEMRSLFSPFRLTPITALACLPQLGQLSASSLRRLL